MTTNHRSKLVRAWNLPWQELEVFIGGKSSIDLPRLRVRDWAEATEFVLNYGFDCNNLQHRRTIHAILIEAINFIERVLLPIEMGASSIPEEITHCEDIRHLLLWASGCGEGQRETLQAWSCATLRVIHTISHIDGTQRRIGIQLASDQVRKRFLPYLRHTEDGRLLLGDAVDFIELDRIDWKIGKSRESMILKLLHKRGNVAETIYDMLGVRIVTKRLSDVVMVIKYLRKFNMVTFANCIPGRTRNNLIDLESLRHNVRKLRRLLKQGKITSEQFNEMLEQASVAPDHFEGTTVANPHTNLNYRSIQLTCRQLVRAPNPNLGWHPRLSELLTSDKISSEQKEALHNMLDFIDGWPGMKSACEVASFYPFEIQVLDESAYRVNQVGDASHDRYKNSQIRAARRRILSEVVALHVD